MQPLVVDLLRRHGRTRDQPIRENRPRKRRIAWPPPVREKKLPHNPRSASGTTGTGVSATMRSMPGRNALSSPVCVSRPSGKMPTTSPFAQRLPNVRERLLHERRVLPRRARSGIARAVRKTKPSTRGGEDAVVHDEADRPAARTR